MQTDFPIDYATITLTDADGRTLLKFVKEKPGYEWAVAGKPMSQKQIEHTEAIRKGHLTPDRVKRLPDGRERLDVPGPLLPWDATTRATLDRLHARFGDMQITVDDLHACIAER